MSYTNKFINVTNEDDDDLSEFIEDVIFQISLHLLIKPSPL
jgi:hypothetical protein